jgi:hypothetical protein
MAPFHKNVFDKKHFLKWSISPNIFRTTCVTVFDIFLIDVLKGLIKQATACQTKEFARYHPNKDD